MQVTIHNAHTVAALDHKLVGVAVKIVAAGGSKLGGPEMERAAGATKYWWDDNRHKVVALVRVFEAPKAA